MAEPIEVSHLRTAANAGTGIKPHDGFAVSMCHGHHMEFHQHGPMIFEARHKVNLKALAASFVKSSPDAEMRASLRLVAAEEIE
jgi:hypothetical protein